jgi:hypothetical protein
MTHDRAIAFGFIAAGVAPAIFFVVNQTVGSHPLGFDALGLLFGSLLFYGCSVAITFLLGYPSLLLLKRINLANAGTATIVGMALSVAVFLTLINSRGSAKEIAFWAGMGGATGIVFWITWRKLDPQAASGK